MLRDVSQAELVPVAPSGMQTCTACGGSGREMAFEWGRPTEWPRPALPCWTCNATGWERVYAEQAYGDDGRRVAA